MLRRTVTALGLHHRPVAGLFFLTVGLALVLGAFYVGNETIGIPSWSGFRLGGERRVPDVMGFVFTAWSICLAIYLSLAHRQLVMAAWSVLFAVFLADDYFTLHERYAQTVSAGLDVSRPQHVGEIIWVGMLGIVLSALIAVAHRYASPQWRAVSRVMVALLAVLVFCGVVLDAIHAFLPVWHVPFVLLEDGGELVATALVFTFLYAVACCGHRPILGTLAWWKQRK